MSAGFDQDMKGSSLSNGEWISKQRAFPLPPRDHQIVDLRSIQFGKEKHLKFFRFIPFYQSAKIHQLVQTMVQTPAGSTLSIYRNTPGQHGNGRFSPVRQFARKLHFVHFLQGVPN